MPVVSPRRMMPSSVGPVSRPDGSRGTKRAARRVGRQLSAADPLVTRNERRPDLKPRRHQPARRDAWRLGMPKAYEMSHWRSNRVPAPCLAHDVSRDPCGTSCDCCPNRSPWHPTRIGGTWHPAPRLIEQHARDFHPWNGGLDYDTIVLGADPATLRGGILEAGPFLLSQSAGVDAGATKKRAVLARYTCTHPRDGAPHGRLIAVNCCVPESNRRSRSQQSRRCSVRGLPVERFGLHAGRLLAHVAGRLRSVLWRPREHRPFRYPRYPGPCVRRRTHQLSNFRPNGRANCIHHITHCTARQEKPDSNPPAGAIDLVPANGSRSDQEPLHSHQ